MKSDPAVSIAYSEEHRSHSGIQQIEIMLGARQSTLRNNELACMIDLMQPGWTMFVIF